MISYVRSANKKPVKKRSFEVVMPQKITLKEAYSIVIGLLPIIMMYRVPIWGVGFSTVLLGLFIPYVLIAFFQGNPRRSWQLVLPVVACFGYFMLRSTGDYENMFLMFISLVHIVCATQETIDFKVLKKTIIYVSLVASVCVYIQTAIYYIFGLDIKFAVPDMIIEELRENFISLSVEGLYRPSAFFAEPSHMTQYICPAIAILMFSSREGERNDSIRKKFVIIIAGVILSTSGMGILVCAISVIIYLFMEAFKEDISRKVPMLITYIVILIATAMVLVEIPFIAEAISRIDGSGTYDALHGRTLFYDLTVGTLEGRDVIFGIGAAAAEDIMEGKYLTGFMEIVLSYGYLGYALFMITQVVPFLKSGKKWYVKYICCVYIGFTFVANLCRFITMCFWFCTIYTAVFENNDETSNRFVKEAENIVKAPYARKVAKEEEVGSYIRDRR